MEESEINSATSRWPLWRQLLVALGGTIILMIVLSGELVRRVESGYLQARLSEQGKRMISLLSSAALDAIISKDRPVLTRTVQEAVESDPRIVKLIITDPTGSELAANRRGESNYSNQRFFEDLIHFEGETFGKVTIVWDITTDLNEIGSHVFNMRLLVGTILLILSGIIMFWIQWLVVSPLTQLSKRIGDPDKILSGRFTSPVLSREVVQLNSTIDERLRAEESKAKALAANAAKSQFLAKMSHEIRTPMNGIIGMSELLLDDELSETHRQSVDTIKSSAKILLDLINDILDLSKIEAGKLELHNSLFSVHRLVRDLVALTQSTAKKKGLELVSLIADNAPDMVIGDAMRLRQVLTNFAANAIKFTDTGSVTISVTLLSSTTDTHELCFSVKDTGIGIPKDKQGKIFEAFEQENSSISHRFGGTGLGLSISKQLVEMMGGWIRVESKPGEGSNFIFTVLVKIPDQKTLSEALAISTPGPTPVTQTSHPLNILVAEDNPVNQTIVLRMLEKHGHKVKVVENGALAIKSLSEGSFDVVILDIEMPVLDGLGASKQIRSLQPELNTVPIIGLSAHAMASDEARCLNAGMDRYLTKPIDRKLLLRTVDELGARKAK